MTIVFQGTIQNPGFFTNEAGVSSTNHNIRPTGTAGRSVYLSINFIQVFLLKGPAADATYTPQS
jgi:hypothetical protein